MKRKLNRFCVIKRMVAVMLCALISFAYIPFNGLSGSGVYAYDEEYEISCYWDNNDGRISVSYEDTQFEYICRSHIPYDFRGAINSSNVQDYYKAVIDNTDAFNDPKISYVEVDNCIEVKFDSKEKLPLGKHIGELSLFFDETGSGSFASKENETADFWLEVLDYKPSDYYINVDIDDMNNLYEGYSTEDVDQFAKEVRVYNNGNATVQISPDGIALEEGSDIDAFRLTDVIQDTITLESGGSAVIAKLKQTEGKAAGYYGTSVIVTDALNRTIDSEYVSYYVKKQGAHLAVDVQEVDFGTVEAESYVDYVPITISNIGEVGFESVTASLPYDSPFRLSDSGFFNMAAGDSEFTNVKVGNNGYVGRKETDYEVNLTIEGTTEEGEVVSIVIPVKLSVKIRRSSFTDEDREIIETITKDNSNDYSIRIYPCDAETRSTLFKLSGQDAKKFKISDYGWWYVEVEPVETLEEGDYNFNIDLYFDPTRSNDYDNAEHVDTATVNLKVIDSNKYCIGIDEEDEYVNLGILQEGYSQSDADALLKSYRVFNTGERPITLNADSYSFGDPEDDCFLLAASEQEITLQPEENYEAISIKPNTGLSAGQYYNECYVTINNQAYWLCGVGFTVVRNGLSLDLDDEELNLGIDPSNKNINYRSKYTTLRNMGSDSVRVTVESQDSEHFKSSYDDFINNSENEYLQLEPGDEYTLKLSADYKKLKENPGKYTNVYTVTATSVLDPKIRTTKTIKVEYAISDEKYSVTLDFQNVGDYENQTITDIPAGEGLWYYFSQLTEAAGFDPEPYEDLIEGNKKYVGISPKPLSQYNSWDEFNEAKDLDNMGDYVSEDITFYVNWAELIDEAHLQMDIPKCGDTIGEQTVEVAETGAKYQVDSIQWASEDEEIIEEGSFVADQLYRAIIKLKTDYGFAMSYNLSVTVNDDDYAYPSGYSDGPEYMKLKTSVYPKHSLEKVNGRSAICGQNGCYKHWKCKGCGALFRDSKGNEGTTVDEVTIEAPSHEYEKMEETALDPDCENEGKEADKKCSRCGSVEEGKTIPALGHDFEIDESTALAPTCTESGRSANKKCKRCGTDVDGETLGALGHSYGEWTSLGDDTHKRVCSNDDTHVETESHQWDEGEITTPPTCATEGVKTFTCATCKATKTETVEIDENAHDWNSGEIISAATCSAEGAKIVTCTICKITKEETIAIDADAHAWNQGEITTTATCATEGVKTFTCQHDASHTKTDKIAIDSDAHSWDEGEITTEATCTTEGVKTFTCQHDASHTKTESTAIDPNKHAWNQGEITTPATCTTAGEKILTCQHDASHTKTETIAVDTNAHAWDKGEITTTATCATEGVKTFTCQNDSSHTKTEATAIEPNAHAWNQGEITTEATCATEGVKTFTCQHDASHTKTESTAIDPNAHAWNQGEITTPATCTTSGEKTFKCRHNESHTKTEPVAIDVNAHAWDDGVITAPATCTKTGEKTFKCRHNELHKKTEAVAALGHNYQDVEGTAKAATCTAPGNKTDQKCSRCSAEKAGAVIAANGHIWDGGTVTKAATSSAEGVKTFKCKTCTMTKTEKIAKLPAPTAGSNPNQKGEGGSAVGKGASAAASESAITKATSDEGPKGSKFAPILLRSTKQGNTNINLTWNKVSKAKKYVIYGNACGKKNKMKKLVTLAGTKKTYNVKKIAKKLKKGTYHKFMIVALDANNNVIATSKVIHVATKGSKKAGNPKKLSFKKPTNLKKGKTHKLAAKQEGKNVKKHRGLAYESSNTAVATVSAKGVIKAKKKGNCYVYIYAQNGLFKKVKITVK